MRIFLAGLVVAIMAAIGLAGSHDGRSDLERGLDSMWSGLHPEDARQLCHLASVYGAEEAGSIAGTQYRSDAGYWAMSIVRHCGTAAD